LTIDYDAVVEALNDLDTKTVPEGGTNISGAIRLAHVVFGKSATGNRALILFTDGEELEGDAVKTAQAAAGEGLRIFTVGVGTPQGSLIPIMGEHGETAFVKDSADQVVKSKLDEKRLREIAQATGGFYLHLENGPRTMRQLYDDGLSRMKAAEIDARLSRRPIERYEWPVSFALIALTLSILIGERKSATRRIRRGERAKERIHVHGPAKVTAATAVLFILLCQFTFGASAGLDAYRNGQFEDAYSQFQQTLQSHPQSRAEDKLQFDSGAAAYKLKDYNRALESFSQALLSSDIRMQSKSHYNLGNTLYERGEAQKSNARKLSDWTNALDHYEQTLKAEPQNKDAKENYDYVKKKIEELKNSKQPEQRPSPSPPPRQKNKRNQQNQQQQEQQQQGQGQQQKEDQQRSQDQQSQGESGNRKDQQQEKQKGESQTKNEEKSNQASPSPSPSEQNQEQSGEGEQPSPTPDENGNEMPSPTPGEGEGVSPSVTPAESPPKKFAGEVKGTGEEKSQKPEDKNAQAADVEAEKKGEMSERQALALIESMKDEEARVQLDERKATRHVYNDW
jgi:Ca-activated chloride channel family protein